MGNVVESFLSPLRAALGCTLWQPQQEMTLPVLTEEQQTPASPPNNQSPALCLFDQLRLRVAIKGLRQHVLLPIR